MNQVIVITVIARDQPGIVRRVSEILRQHQGNWHKSSMSQLAGQFAGILECTLPQDQLDACLKDLQALSADGIHVSAVVGSAGEEETPLRRFSLELVGNDRAGIVADIARILAEFEVNVESLETVVESASMAGGALFRADASLQLNENTRANDLRDALEAIANDLMVEIVLEDGSP